MKIKQNKRLFIILLIPSFLLLIPFIAMLFTDELNWTASDFIIAGFLLYGTGLVCEFILRKVKKLKYRIALCGIILVILILIWVELAVGVFS